MIVSACLGVGSCLVSKHAMLGYANKVLFVS